MYSSCNIFLVLVCCSSLFLLFLVIFLRINNLLETLVLSVLRLFSQVVFFAAGRLLVGLGVQIISQSIVKYPLDNFSSLRSVNEEV